MKVTQAVFGVFHHFELAHQLHQRQHLQKIYSTWPWARLKREGLPHSLVSCFPLLHTADYLLNRTRFYPASISAKMGSWNARGFDRWTRNRIQPCDAFIAISGAGLLTGRKVQDSITFKQDNRWSSNTYVGPWQFTPYETSRTVTAAAWQADPYAQDAGSSFSGS